MLVVILALMLAGCGTAAASQAGPGNEAERLATLSRSIAGRFDALAADDALLFDDGWRSETVRELRQAAALAGGMARQAPAWRRGWSRRRRRMRGWRIASRRWIWRGWRQRGGRWRRHRRRCGDRRRGFVQRGGIGRLDGFPVIIGIIREGGSASGKDGAPGRGFRGG